MDTYLAIVQTATVVAAVGGLGVALLIAAEDRRSAERTAEEDRRSSIATAEEDRRSSIATAEMDRRSAAAIADKDRRSARREAERRHRLDLLIRLAQNLERGGSSDSLERARLGAEASALITALGPDVLPELFAAQGDYEEGIQRLSSKPSSEWNWAERADAVRIALRDVAESRLS